MKIRENSAQSPCIGFDDPPQVSRQARGPSAATRQARGPSAAARQARGLKNVNMGRLATLI